MRECGGVVVTAGASACRPIPQEQKKGCRRRGVRKKRNSEAMQNNINRDEMKQHPHFCFLLIHSVCLLE